MSTELSTLKSQVAALRGALERVQESVCDFECEYVGNQLVHSADCKAVRAALAAVPEESQEDKKPHYTDLPSCFAKHPTKGYVCSINQYNGDVDYTDSPKHAMYMPQSWWEFCIKMGWKLIPAAAILALGTNEKEK